MTDGIGRQGCNAVLLWLRFHVVVRAVTVCHCHCQHASLTPPFFITFSIYHHKLTDEPDNLRWSMWRCYRAPCMKKNNDIGLSVFILPEQRQRINSAFLAVNLRENRMPLSRHWGSDRGRSSQPIARHHSTMNLQLGSRHQPPISPDLILCSQQLVIRLQHRIFTRQFLNALQIERAIPPHHLRILRPPNQQPIGTTSVFNFDGLVWGLEVVC